MQRHQSEDKRRPLLKWHVRRNALQLPVLWNTWRQRLSNWAWILHNTAGGPKKMLRNESLQARKSLSGTPPFRLRLLFVCLFVYDQLKWKIYFDQWILFKKRNDPQRWAAIREIGERKFEKKKAWKGLELVHKYFGYDRPSRVSFAKKKKD